MSIKLVYKVWLARQNDSGSRKNQTFFTDKLGRTNILAQTYINGILYQPIIIRHENLFFRLRSLIFSKQSCKEDESAQANFTLRMNLPLKRHNCILLELPHILVWKKEISRLSKYLIPRI